MMKKLLVLAALVVAPTLAHAQGDQGAPNPEEERATAEMGNPAAIPEDPSADFNWLNFHYLGKDVKGGKFGDGEMVDPRTHEVEHEEEPMSPPFILALVNFGLFLLILAKYLAPAGHTAAKERHDQIKSALDEAGKLRDEAKAKLAEYESRISGLDSEIEKLVAGIRADAEADKQRILEAAEKQAAQMKRDAESRIAAEIELARQHLTEEVAQAASAAAAKLVRERATADDQKRLVSTFIAGLGGQS